MIDTIVAVSTAAGPAAVALTRLSGARALELTRAVAPGLPDEPPARTPILVNICDQLSGEGLDQALVTFFPAPASYTGEDVVEISGHGGWMSPVLIVEAIVSAGARPAEPGEFTRRAYLNGKLDLVQVEAVADLVEGRNRALHRAALHQLERGLSGRLLQLREDLVKIEALLVHHLDFPEEDDAPVPADTIVEQARTIIRALDELLATAPEGELLREGAMVVLAGRPNAGKSSVFNMVVGDERAIVTELPGTTRDALEASVSVGGFPFRLVDTAGLREAADKVEQLGIEVAQRYLARANGVVFCVEAGRELDELEESFLRDAEVPVLLLRTKADLTSDRNEGRGLPLSVQSGEGVSDFFDELRAMGFAGLSGLEPEAPVVTRERQRKGLELARTELIAFAEGLANGLPAEVASTFLRPAETALEELLGVISREEVLDALFANFCIGK